MEILPLLDFSKHVLVIGDTVLEKYVHGSYSSSGVVCNLPTFTQESVEYKLAGSGNIVSNLLVMGISVDLITVFGREDKKVEDLLKETGIDTKGVLISPDFSIEKNTRYFSKQRLCFQSIENGTYELPSDAKKNLIEKLNEINMESYNLVIITCSGQALISSLLVKKVISSAQKYDIPTLVEMKNVNTQILRQATYIKLTDIDCHEAKNEKSHPASVCKNICEDSTVKCVFSSCEKGFGFYEKNRSPLFHFCPITDNIKVIDSFGAEDSVLAAVAFGLVNNWSSFDTSKFAITCASNVLTRFGISPVNMIDIMSQKVLTNSKELKILKRLLPKDTTTVLTTGCFDLIHTGHIESLRQAKEIGDLVFVALNSDVSVKSYKADTRPIIPIGQRCSMLEAVKYVDFIIIFDEPKPTWIVDILQPDVFVKGAEYSDERIRQSFPTLRKIHLTPQLTSTSQIIKKIKDL